MLLFQRQPIAAALALMVLTATAPAAAEENAAARRQTKKLAPGEAHRSDPRLLRSVK
jgi:hypothetical protein